MRLLCMTGIDRFEVPDDVGIRLGLSSRQKADLSGADWAMYRTAKKTWVGLTKNPARASFFNSYKFSNVFLPGTKGEVVGSTLIVQTPYEPVLSGPELFWFKQINPAIPETDNLIAICGAEKEEIRRDSCGIFVDRWGDIWEDAVEMQIPMKSLKEMMNLPVIGQKTIHFVIPPTL